LENEDDTLELADPPNPVEFEDDNPVKEFEEVLFPVVNPNEEIFPVFCPEEDDEFEIPPDDPVVWVLKLILETVLEFKLFELFELVEIFDIFDPEFKLFP
jgi:hypothetical protein